MNDQNSQIGIEAITDLQSYEVQLKSLIASLNAEISAIQPMVEMGRRQLDEATTAKAQISALLVEVESKALDTQNAVASLAAVNQQNISEFELLTLSTEKVKSLSAEVSSLKVNVDEQLQSVTQTASKVAADADDVKASRDSVTAALDEIKSIMATARENSSDIEDTKAESASTAQSLKKLADKAFEVDKRIAEYEKRLAALDEQATSNLETIIGLLPAATSAGLASAFDQRRQAFLKPSSRWQWLFVGSVISLVLLAFTGFVAMPSASEPIRYETILNMWLIRLPIAASLVWLALHSSREAALAKRLEEDYGFKAAMAASFQGFQKQMAEIGNSASPDSPLKKLCEDTLATIASPPGRIYERQALTVTPGSEVVNAARAVSEATGVQRSKVGGG